MTTEIRHDLARDFMGSFDAISGKVHLNAVDKGWWEPHEVPAFNKDGTPLLDENGIQIVVYVERTPAEILALIHSEASEALEAIRHGNPPSEKIPEFTSEEEEHADIIIRQMDYAKAKGLRLAPAILAKIEFNMGRSYKHGGKAL